MGKSSQQPRKSEKKSRSNGFLWGKKKKKRRMTAQEASAKSKELAAEIEKQCYSCEEMLGKSCYGYKQWIAANPKDRKCLQCTLPPDYGASKGYKGDDANMQGSDDECDWENVHTEENGESGSYEDENAYSISEKTMEWIRKTF